MEPVKRMFAASSVLGIHVGSTGPAFLAILAVHVPAGTAAVFNGVAAAISPKDSDSHVRFGRRYYIALGVVFVTAIGLAALRWREDGYLVVLGALAVAAATYGVLRRRRGRPGGTAHIVGMGGSFAVFLTAFYVDNGPHLPLLDHLPSSGLLDRSEHGRRSAHRVGGAPRTPAPATRAGSGIRRDCDPYWLRGAPVRP